MNSKMRAHTIATILIGILIFSVVNIGFMLLPTEANAEPSSMPTTSTWVTNGRVLAIAHYNGITYIGGQFTLVGPQGGPMQSRNNIAALDAAGRLTDWDPNASWAVTCLAVSGTTVYAGGGFGNIGGQLRNNIAALDISTGQATGWNPNADDSIRALVVSGTTVYAGGEFANIGGQPRSRIAALDISTGQATGWNPNVTGLYIVALEVSDTIVYAGGSFAAIGGQPRNHIAALDASTGLATTWDPNPNSIIRNIVVSGTTVYVGGYFTTVNGSTTRNRLAAFPLSPNTATAKDWNPNANAGVNDLEISGNTIYAAGPFTLVNGSTVRNRFAAFPLSPNTATATEWDPNANAVAWALVASPSGETLYAGGEFTAIGGIPRTYFAQFNDPFPVPLTTSVTPTAVMSHGPEFTLTVNGANFIPISVVRWNGEDRPTTYLSPTQLTAVIPASDLETPGMKSITVFNPLPGGGSSNAQMVAVNSVSSSWYLAEGTTAWEFETYITIQNPNTSAVDAKVTFMPAGQPNVIETVSLPARSQTTLTNDHLIDKLGGQMDFSTKVVSSDLTKAIAVDRTMSWNGQGSPYQEAHNSVGVNAPTKTWYLPEGSTNWGFETWLCIQNPNASKATCQVTYMIEGGDPVTTAKEVPANSRESFNMFDDIGNQDASIRVTSNIPVIPERSMYRNARREGHNSIGTTSSTDNYYLAEGTTAWGFTTYVTVQNPNDQAVSVNLTYMTADGPRQHPENPIAMLPNSRKTVRVNDFLPNADFSTRLHGSLPIIAERSMYWDNGTGEACHDSIGMSSPHMVFYLPDGQTSEGRETWTLVQNPNDSEIQIQITYMTPNGQGNVSKVNIIPENSRRTFNMLEHSGINGRAAVLVVSKSTDKPIMVERAMYWNSRGAGTDTLGGCGD